MKCGCGHPLTRHTDRTGKCESAACGCAAAHQPASRLRSWYDRHCPEVPDAPPSRLDLMDWYRGGRS